ncbi:MAG: flagellar basal body rod protein FlgC [Candidatus Latescibacterota bacterium]|nr:MAG: flagellar basal body rod protein FlgC [Candidatus Latescibacterota bacterium]RKY72259.1 MAG: flagellar basal body rod protein FlgC [Candidatus Latescibacterota bacterium]
MLGRIFAAINISSQGLSAQRKRMEATALNIANVNTTRTQQGGPYRRRKVIIGEISPRANFGATMRATVNRLRITRPNHIPQSKGFSIYREAGGVEAKELIDRTSSPKMVYDPTHPDANEDGYVAYPNIDVITEMVNMITASRIYEANVTAINAAKGIIKKSLEI